MKKLLYLLLIATLLSACSNDDDPPLVVQDYTSFVVFHNEDVILTNCIAGYKQADNTYKKLGNLGDLKKGIPSTEVKLTDKSITEIYIFTDYGGKPRRFDAVYKLVQNTKNNIEIKSNTTATPVNDTSNPLEYPQ